MEVQNPAAPRVVIDARKITDGGIGTYIHNLLIGLLECTDVQVRALCSSQKREALPTQYQASAIIENAKPYSLDELFGLGPRLRREQFDLFHSPHFTLPFGLHCPSVVTIHDLIHLRCPEHFWYPLIARPLIRSALTRAHAVIAVSDTTRQDVEAFMRGMPGFESKISVIPNALNPDIEQQMREYRRESEEPYLLGVFSNSKPHKGLTELLKAFTAFKEQKGRMAEGSYADRLKLVLVGAGSEEAQAVHADIVCCGVVSREELCALYCDAESLVVASRIEGFCLPVLEAKACGTPVLTTPAPAVLELIGPQDIVCSHFGAAEIELGFWKLVARAEECGGRLPRGASGEIIQRYNHRSLAKQVAALYRLQTQQPI
jgi:glycosyltransferase involved in cell wall biosynthesis